MKRVFFLAAILSVVTAVSGAYFWHRVTDFENGSDFIRKPSPIRSYDLFDLGVTTLNDDRYLDIFTANHSARQDLLVNDGSGRYQDVLSAKALDQDRQFPQLEDSLLEPSLRDPGLYIYRTNRWLYFRAHRIDAPKAVEGTISAPWPLMLRQAPQDVTVSAQATSTGSSITTVKFRLKGNETLILSGVEDIVEIPHHTVLRDDIDLATVFVGLAKVNPDSHEFDLVWRDRHGMAWADYNGDTVTDLFIARGGIKGQLDRFQEPISDELFAGAGTSFVNITESSGLVKGNCPGRQVAWIDYDSDDDLDLYVSCGRGDVPSYPNLLFRQEQDNSFTEVAAVLGLDYGTATVFAWVDSDLDGDPDLLSLEGDRIYHYVNHGGRFDRQPVGNELAGAQPYKFTVADFDNDGDFDAFAVHGRKSHLLRNSGGTFELESAASVGLPAAARTANWLDFDNDGLLDLHVVPGGLYQQRIDHSFTKLPVLQIDEPGVGIVDARAAWFDANNDGYRDLLAAFQTGPTLWQRALRKLTKREPDLGNHWHTAFFEYTGPTMNHWLQVDLTGYRQNRQAIGASVAVRTPTGIQLQQVGGAEGSHFSQGHFRTYFGLGENPTVDEIRVTWPNGVLQVVRNVPANELLQIAYDSDDQIDQ